MANIPDLEASLTKIPDGGSQRNEEIVPDPLGYLTRGYPRLAGRMGEKPEVAIFRRFNELNAKNLLYMQAELHTLEQKLAEVEVEDAKGSPDRAKYATNFESMEVALTLAGNEDDIACRQIKLIFAIRDKLKDYNEALIQTSMMHQLRIPDMLDVEDLQRFLSDEKGLNNSLRGRDFHIWGSTEYPDRTTGDLVSVKPRIKEDAFSRWLAERVTGLLKYPFVKWFKKPDKRTGAVSFYDSSLHKFTFWVVSFVASLIPVASIVLLVNLHTLETRVGAIAGFNVLVSVCLIVFTEASRKDIFTTIAAFSALQVVFVGQSLDHKE